MSSFEHTVLVTAAGGNIGSALIPQLLESNYKLVLPTSNAGRLQSQLPPSATSSNVIVAGGSIADPAWIQSLLIEHNVDVVFLCLTGSNELFTTMNFFSSMQRAGTVKQLIYLSACGDFVSDDGIKHLMRICSAAHVIVKSTVEQKLAYAGFPWKTTILGPTLFMSNDIRSKKSMLEQGVFDEPVGEKGVSRVSTDDIALALCNAIADPDKWAEKKVMIGSRRRFTATEIAQLWSEAIGREVKPCPIDDESKLAFEKHFAQIAGVDWGRDLRLMYDIFIAEGFGMSDDDYETQVELLGKEPLDYEQWVKETGSGWR